MKSSKNSSGLSSNTWVEDSNQQSMNEQSEFTGYDLPVYDEKLLTEHTHIKNLPVIGRLKKSTQYILASLGIAISGGLLFGNIWYNHNNAIDIQVSKDAANELGFLLNQSKSDMNNFLTKNPNNFSQLKGLYSIIDKDISYISSGDKVDPAAITNLKGYWLKIKQGLDNLLASQDAIVQVNDSINSTSDGLKPIINQSLSALNSMSKDGSGSNSKQAVYLSQIITILQRIDKNITALKTPNADYNTIVAQLWNDNKVLPLAYSALLKGSGSLGNIQSKEVRDQLNNSLNAYQDLSPQIVNITQIIGALSKNIETNNKIIALNGNGIIENVKTSLLNYERSTSIYENLVWLFALLFVSFISLLMAINTKENQKTYAALKYDQALTKSSIIKIIEDLGVIGQGNLSHKVRLSEGRLMSLSDSINATVGKISDLIEETSKSIDNINKSNKHVFDVGTSVKDDITSHRNKMNEAVTYFIEINTIIQELERMLKHSQEISENSVNTISRGSDAIETSQKSIEAIYTRVQEAQERVEKLVSSTIEISEIASNLINLSERMDVLATHASVRAAKVGESGKGFNVIAEGVQQISNQFGEHSKRINALIDTTHSNIMATTQAIKMAVDEIDEGTRLTTIVDNSFNTLGNLSTHLNESIKNIESKYETQKEQNKKITSVISAVIDINDDVGKHNDDMLKNSGEIRKETSSLNRNLTIYNVKNLHK